VNKIDRIKGCIFAGAIGDAFGHPYEGRQTPIPDFDHTDWEISDDTQMTLATCEAISESAGKVDPAAIAASFSRWHRESRITGMGASTLKALTELTQGGHWALVGNKGERAAGNGAAMRIAPLAFCLDHGNRESRQIIRDVSRITHHNEEAYVGALAVVIAIRIAFDGDWNGDQDLLQMVIDSLPDSRVRDRLVEITSLGNGVSLSELGRRFGRSGYVVDSVPLALVGSSRIIELGFENMLLEIVSGGGDTDTTASIAGQVAGSLIGRDQLPARALEKLPDQATIEKIAIRFVSSLQHLN